MSETSAYWLERWRDEQIGFHEGMPNAYLAEHVDRLGPGPGRRVLVPLCGKSIDLAFLAAHGFSVVGVELSPIAAEAFFTEAELAVTRTADGKRLSARGIEIVIGDVFTMSARELGTFDALYDRAALVALSPSERARYAAVIRSLLGPGALGLLVTYEHDGDPSEPPYSVTTDEIAKLWPTLERDEIAVSDTSRDRLSKKGATFGRTRVIALRAQ